MYEHGIFKINDTVNGGNTMNYDQFVEQVSSDIHFLEYMQVIAAIPNARKICLQLSSKKIGKKIMKCSCHTKKSKECINNLVGNEQLLAVKWKMIMKKTLRNYDY